MKSIWPSPNDIFLTFLRWLIGLGAGTLLGLIIALLEAIAAKLSKKKVGWRVATFAGLLDFLRALPIIALVPIVQMLGVKERWKISLIAWAVMFPIWLAVRQAYGRQMIDTELALFASGLRSKDIFWHYRIPKALIGLLKGVEISIGVAWISTVASEWVGTFNTGFWAGGLGYKIVQAHDANNWKAMLSCLMLFGVSGVATSWIWRKLTSKMLSFGFNPLVNYGE